jgi:hypothetical protein
MARKAQAQQVTLIGARGAKLPVSECTLVSIDSENFTVQTMEKSGRGRGVRTVTRTYVIPKSLVQYYYTEEEADGSTADAVQAAPAPRKSPGRPRKEKAAADATEDAAPKKRRGRPKKVAVEETAAADAAPKKRRGRPKKVEVEETAAADAAPKKRRGRPKKSETSEDGDTGESGAPSRGKGSSLFDETW